MEQAFDHKLHDITSIVHDCWNKTGVQGDLSCAELNKHAHCRNCPVYRGAAIALLDIRTPDGYFDERAKHFAKAWQAQTQGARSVMIFRIGTEWLALPTAMLTEVLQARPLHRVPHRSSMVKGLANVHGELLIVFSLGKLLGLTHSEPVAQEEALNAHKRLIVIESKEGRLVFPVDEIVGTHDFYSDELQAVPVTIAKSAQPYTYAALIWNQHTVGCLEGQLLLDTLDRSLA